MYNVYTFLPHWDASIKEEEDKFKDNKRGIGYIDDKKRGKVYGWLDYHQIRNKGILKTFKGIIIIACLFLRTIYHLIIRVKNVVTLYAGKVDPRQANFWVFLFDKVQGRSLKANPIL